MSTEIILYEPPAGDRQIETGRPSLHIVTPAAPIPLDAYLPAYLAALKAKGHRPRGIDKYAGELRYFIKWLPPDATMSIITTAVIQQYQEVRAEHCSPGTVAMALTTIRSFCRWAMKRGFRSDDPTLDLDWPKKRHASPRALKFAELRTLMLAINNEPARLGPVRRWYWHRNRRAMYLMLFAGLRISEVSALRWCDVDLETEELWVRDGKGGKDRCIPIHQALLYELELVPLIERQADYAVAGNADGSLQTFKSLDHVFRRWLPQLGITISAHQLRHTFATEMLRNDADLLMIKELLGHASLETTQRYLKTDTKRMRAAVDRLPSNW